MRQPPAQRFASLPALSGGGCFDRPDAPPDASAWLHQGLWERVAKTYQPSYSAIVEAATGLPDPQAREKALLSDLVKGIATPFPAVHQGEWQTCTAVRAEANGEDTYDNTSDNWLDDAGRKRRGLPPYLFNVMLEELTGATFEPAAIPESGDNRLSDSTGVKTAVLEALRAGRAVPVTAELTWDDGAPLNHEMLAIAEARGFVTLVDLPSQPPSTYSQSPIWAKPKS